ncbi:hypothetical protein GOM49_10250 [Clostridium bovifaecis]|uniref:Uncharacterized protein n=1 Tax=Clostridium bovifaecis TaxID=2184719 RepID=A0A6I6F4W0_9CLOT|nr:hypothetical protein GOM49_10250 [Clostridium bovifaecis]
MRVKYFSIFLLPFIIFFQSAGTGLAKDQHVPMTCEEKLKLLEPTEPKTIYDYELLRDRDMSNFQEEVLPISLVQKTGIKVPFSTVYKDLNWQRPVYSPLWHSSSWRWSYVPLNMAYQRHIVFDYQGGLSWWYDLSSYLALPNGIDTASPIHEYAFTIKYPYVVRLIVFNFNITSIKHYKNQILVSGEPLRKGLTLVDFDTKNLPASKKLLQLATPDGHEIDYLYMYLGNH